jgi:hypothetical protein
MRRLLFGFIAAFVGFGALASAPAPAQAQGFSITVGEPYGRPPVRRIDRSYERPVHYRPAPVYRPYPRYARPVGVYGGYPGYARPAYYAGPRCVVRSSRVWDGFEWVVRRREICR